MILFMHNKDKLQILFIVMLKNEQTGNSGSLAGVELTAVRISQAGGLFLGFHK